MFGAPDWLNQYSMELWILGVMNLSSMFGMCLLNKKKYIFKNVRCLSFTDSVIGFSNYQFNEDLKIISTKNYKENEVIYNQIILTSPWDSKFTQKYFLNTSYYGQDILLGNCVPEIPRCISFSLKREDNLVCFQ